MTYEVNGIHYLFILKKTTAPWNRRVHIHRINSDGSLGSRIARYRWSNGWTSVSTYKIGGQVYLMIYKKSGSMHIHEIRPDGKVGTKIDDINWEDDWTTIEPFEMNQQQYVFVMRKDGYNSNGKNVQIFRLDSNGISGSPLIEYTWMEGWTSAKFYKKNGTTYLLLVSELEFSSLGSNAHIHEMNLNNPNALDGTVGNRIADYTWTKGWDVVEVSTGSDGVEYLYLCKSGENYSNKRGEVYLYSIKDSGEVGTRVMTLSEFPDYYPWHIKNFWGAFNTGRSRFPARWFAGWDQANFYTISGKTYLFILKSKLRGYPFSNARFFDFHPMHRVGPMVGQVTKDSATIWVSEPGGKLVTGTVEVVGNNFIQTFPVNYKFSAINQDYYNLGLAVITGLSPSTTYNYEVKVNNVNVSLAGALFTTAPDPSSNTQLSFRAAVSSCMDQAVSQNAWSNVLNKMTVNGTDSATPMMNLLLGDNVYVNSSNRGNIWQGHLQQRSHSGFASLLQRIPTYAIWDDHDFGPNNSSGADLENEIDKDYFNKDIDNRISSMQAFKEVFALPDFGGSEGIYYKFRWGKVDFFALDGRYFRVSQDNNDSAKPLLGELNPDGPQWTWLKNEMNNSTAKFKVVLSGSTLGHWEANYPVQYNELLNLLNPISGVVFLSGDIHELQYNPANPQNNVNFPEFVSSGVGHGPNENGFLILDFDDTNDNVTARFYKKDGTPFNVGTGNAVVVNA